ncbi:MAG: efflux RND transporter permease subunit [Solirubrobacterales bacterium]
MMKRLLRSRKALKPKIDIATWIVNHGKAIEIVFIVFSLLNGLFFFFVKVNYDLSVYLPASAPSKKGLVLMEKEFGYPGTARVMLNDVSLYEAKMYKDKIASIPGVNMVVWVDSFANIYESADFLNFQRFSDYYKDSCACMDVVFKEGDGSENTYKTIEQIRRICGDKGYLGGPAVQSMSLVEILDREMKIILVFGVVIILLILILTTRSWFEPVLFMIVIGISIVINMGSNILMGQISFLTYSIAAVLQLAIAIDYSIFLLNAYAHEKAKGLASREAMIHAIRNSAKSIITSCAAAIVGFMVMAVMEFKIGLDIGLVMAKGIFIALITITLLMPALVMQWNHLIERTRHRSFMPSFRKLGETVYKYRVIPVAAVAVILFPSFVGQSMCDFTYGMGGLLDSPGVKVYEDEKRIFARFGKSNLVLLLVPNNSFVSERALEQKLAKLPTVKSVVGLAGFVPEGIPVSILPKALTGIFQTDRYTRILVNVRSSDESDLAFRTVNQITRMMHSYYPKGGYVVGRIPSTQDIKEYIVKDYERVDVLGMLGVALTVAAAFGSLSLPIIVVIPIKSAFFINMNLQYIMGRETMYIGYLVVGCLQLGATIDYSILITDKYLEARKHANRKESTILAVSESALSVFTSGFILAVVGYGIYYISSVSAIGGLGQMIAQGALCSMALSIGMLPGLLYYTDPIFMGKFRKTFTVRNVYRIAANRRRKRKGSIPILEEAASSEEVAQ